ncbi:MAG: DedA family protein [Planctomycetaceae bacterium]
MSAPRPTLALIEQLVQWVGPVFTTIGYLLVPVAVFLETSALIGLLVPGDVILALGGVYCARGDLAVPVLLPLAIVAAWAGQTTGFFLGRRYGEGLVRRLPLVNRVERHLDEAEVFLQRHGGKALVLGRFATGVAAFIPFAAGMARVAPRRFLAFMIPTTIVWASLIFSVGYFLGTNLPRVDRVLSRIGWGALAIVVAGVGVAVVVRRRRERRTDRQA